MLLSRLDSKALIHHIRRSVSTPTSAREKDRCDGKETKERRKKKNNKIEIEIAMTGGRENIGTLTDFTVFLWILFSSYMSTTCQVVIYTFHQIL